jgi:serine/threonine protein kinase
MLATTRNHFFIDMELCSFSLRTYIDNVNSCINDQNLPPPHRVTALPERTAPINVWGIMKQISAGLAFMHNGNKVHRDIKPDNSIFPFERPSNQIVLYSAEQSMWKIADFGFVSQVSSKRSIRASSAVRGTDGYRAPELQTDEPRYSTKTDIWALGCVLHDLAFGRPAFKGDWAAPRLVPNSTEASSPKQTFPLDQLEWADSDKNVLVIMLERTLAIKGYFRPSAGEMVHLIENILEELDGMPADELTPSASSNQPLLFGGQIEPESPETEPETHPRPPPDIEHEAVNISKRPIKQRCGQCSKSYPVENNLVKHGKTWMEQIRENSCPDCESIFSRNEVTSITKVLIV